MAGGSTQQQGASGARGATSREQGLAFGTGWATCGIAFTGTSWHSWEARHPSVGSCDAARHAGAGMAAPRLMEAAGVGLRDGREARAGEAGREGATSSLRGEVATGRATPSARCYGAVLRTPLTCGCRRRVQRGPGAATRAPSPRPRHPSGLTRRLPPPGRRYLCSQEWEQAGRGLSSRSGRNSWRGGPDTHDAGARPAGRSGRGQSCHPWAAPPLCAARSIRAGPLRRAGQQHLRRSAMCSAGHTVCSWGDA